MAKHLKELSSTTEVYHVMMKPFSVKQQERAEILVHIGSCLLLLVRYYQKAMKPSKTWPVNEQR